MIFEYQLDIFRDYGGLMLNPLGLHPYYPFIHPLHFEITEVPDKVKWLLWYLTHLYQMGRREGLDYCSSKACQTGLSLMAKGSTIGGKL
ncbi:hypothetical protein V6N12_033178 [Hibiscus sabdariffa]|uniref:Uncharacterized protein n=1 Tax=Hibiscus sabdariffa TaxID=183260 RepID=A0ABR2BDI0_9ROSI